MADILIRGMSMPKYTTKAEFGIDADGNSLCMVYHENGTEPDIYDVIPLTEGHGRLIDADALQAKFELMENAFAEHGRPYSFAFKDGGEMCAEWWTVQDALAREPTIIEAEGGTDNG